MHIHKILNRLFWLPFLLAAACSSPTPAAEAIPTDAPTAPPEPVTLRLAVALTPQELESFQVQLDNLDAAHPEFEVELEVIPQQSLAEKINTQLAANELADVVRVQGLLVQGWIRQNAFLDLGPLMAKDGVMVDDFYPGPVAQFEWQDTLWGLPDTAAPEVVFYNKDMFDAAGLAYPSDAWAYEDMREAAVQLTLDDQGRNAADPEFDPENIVQWGWNGGLTYFWQRHLVRGFGGDFCANPDCTEMIFTAPETLAAVEWWASLTHDLHATLYDPYGGSQTGVPGDPFIAGAAAMGYNGFFAVGQLNTSGDIRYGVIQPLLGSNGNRYTPLSTNGYVISSGSEHPQEAWLLVQALLDADFLAETWGQPGHAVPAVRAAANSIINPESGLENQEAIVAAMEYGEVFKPYTNSAFAVYGQTMDLFVQTMRGDIEAEEALEQIEAIANEVLADDRAE